ncbi:Sterol 3-beta-glucosyltransferase [Arachnomyces sp. PD_36]|nr:Sterol 3-beta-glucosyltransferase [Arachnomyces sp. PD_36]
MPPLEEPPKKRVLHKRNVKKSRAHIRSPSTQIPDAFKDGDDAQDDVSAPPPAPGGRADAGPFMHQSIFSMIAAAGSTADFHSRFDEPSDTDGEGEDTSAADKPPKGVGKKVPAKQDEQTTSPTPDASDQRGRRHLRKISDNSLLKSLPKLPRKRSKGKEPMSRTTHDLSAPHDAEITSPVALARTMTSGEAPVLGRMLEAQARFDSSSSAVDSKKKKTGELLKPRPSEDSAATLLSTRLKEIFGFEKPEEVIAEYPCWLLQSVLLQGYLYITAQHICFYAYLPKSSNSVAKSGYLSKRGRQNPKYNRYWCTLKGDVLSYYLDPSNLYFPSGHVDLRYGISAALAEQKDKEKDVKDLTVTTDQRTYQFRADSSTSAKEWVKTLQKVIFRSHNDGDSVKISLPIENVVDIEENPVIDFAETYKIRVVESDETYAIDEYFFSFFNLGKDAFNVMKILIDDSSAQHKSPDLLPPTSPDTNPSHKGRKSVRQSLDSERPVTPSHPLSESVKATLRHQSRDGLRSPRGQSPRVSGDFGRSSADLRRSHDRSSQDYGRASFEPGRRSESTDRFGQKESQQEKQSVDKLHSSTGSFVHSVGPDLASSPILQSTTDTAESASQILNRSDVFQSPTIHRLRGSPSGAKDGSRRHSEDDSSPIGAKINVQPPSRTVTYENLRSKTGDDMASESENEAQAQNMTYSVSTPTLQELVKAGSYPLQRAAGFADFLKNRSKRMSNLLASESMGYFEKVSGMWAGGKRHYGETERVIPDDRMADPEDEEDGCGHGDRFRAHFALPPTEKLQATYFGHLYRVLPLYGKIYISNRKFCFRSLLPGTRTKLILPLSDIENVEKEKGFRFGYHGLVVIIRGHEELFFEFNGADVRDDCAVTLHQSLESIKYLVESGLLAQEDKHDAELAKAEHQMLQDAKLEDHDDEQAMSSSAHDSQDTQGILFDDTRASIINFKPSESLRITCLTIGSRGDVQPYIALCKGLLAEGHKPKIATHAEFEPWVRSHGIEFAPVDGDPAELMRICVENGMFTYSFLKEASYKFRGWIDDLLSSAWQSCQDSDILIESPSAMAGIHIAEALRIPYFRAFTMPWTRTRAYPHAFAVPEHKMGGAYNYITYVMFDNVFWKAIAGQVNRWRKKELGLRSTNLDKMQPNKVPFLYNFSPSVVVPPLDYSDWIRVTGYWFLDEATDWTPPEDVKSFIAKARADNKKIVYIGFGSIVVSDPAALTKTVVDSVIKADVRCILSKGWSDRLGDPASTKPEVPLPPEILRIKSVPHDWLFKQIDAAAHHGGAGTTGASLRAGIPTIVKPFFGDQFFFGSRVEDLGVGICMKKLNVSVFSRALWEATHSQRMIVKANVLGDQIRSENGVATAIQAIYRDLEYAKTLVKQRSNASTPGGVDSGTDADRDDFPHATDDLTAIEETWTFIGDEATELDLARRVRNRDNLARISEAEVTSDSPLRHSEISHDADPAFDSGDEAQGSAGTTS